MTEKSNRRTRPENAGSRIPKQSLAKREQKKNRSSCIARVLGSWLKSSPNTSSLCEPQPLLLSNCFHTKNYILQGWAPDPHFVLRASARQGLLALPRPESVEGLVLHCWQLEVKCSNTQDVVLLISELAGSDEHQRIRRPPSRNTYRDQDHQHKHTSTPLGKPIRPSFLRLTLFMVESRDWAEQRLSAALGQLCYPSSGTKLTSALSNFSSNTKTFRRSLIFNLLLKLLLEGRYLISLVSTNSISVLPTCMQAPPAHVQAVVTTRRFRLRMCGWNAAHKHSPPVQSVSAWQITADSPFCTGRRRKHKHHRFSQGESIPCTLTADHCI